ncbi:hypothetical protein [uncultured Clostridium sp.]|uniref:hypothetical protein n=1 Tax=uncultured Clostridium sp. TaxID=59620 RepID=UPI00266F7C74|nr:hypothetical protein [uncultured Clostridium sp.]
MLNEINIKLKKLKNDVSLKSTLNCDIEMLDNNLNKEEKELRYLERQLNKEKKQMDDLNKLSISNIFTSIFKNKKSKKENQEKEYLDAKVKYEKQLLIVNSLREKIKIKRNELDKIENCEEEYDKLMDEKINVLKLQGDYFTKEKIRLLDEKLNEYLKINEDIRKTHKIGKNLLEEVKLAKHDLEWSKKWGKVDMVAKDSMSSIAKQNKIRKVKLKFENIEKLINQFNKELEDIKINNLEFSNITFAMDIFFDNIFTDISVERQINDSIEDIERLEDKVQNILYKLQIKNEEVIKKINNVKNDYISFVEEAS